MRLPSGTSVTFLERKGTQGPGHHKRSDYDNDCS